MKYELIKELAEKAGYEMDVFGVGIWDDQKLHNFAQLILQECLTTVITQKQWVVNQKVYSVSDQNWNNARIQQSQHIHDKMVEHFQ